MASAAFARPLLARSLLRGARSPALAVRLAEMAVAPQKGYSSVGDRFSVTLDSLNPNLKQVRYAVRGPILDRAMAIQRDLEEVNFFDQIFYSRETHGAQRFYTACCVLVGTLMS